MLFMCRLAHATAFWDVSGDVNLNRTVILRRQHGTNEEKVVAILTTTMSKTQFRLSVQEVKRQRSLARCG